MEMFGKLLLAVVLLLFLSSMFPMPENYTNKIQLGGGDMQSESVPQPEMMAPMMASQVEPVPQMEAEMMPPRMEERVIHSHEVPSEMGPGPVMKAPSAQGEVMGIMEDAFGAFAFVPKCEDEFCPGCLFCQTPKSSSCGYPTDDKQAGRPYMDVIKRIRQDRGEDWNMNFKISE